MSPRRSEAPLAKRCEYTREIGSGKFETLLYLGKVNDKRKYFKKISHSLTEAQKHDQEAEDQKASGSWRAQLERRSAAPEGPTGADPLSIWNPIFAASPTRNRQDPEISTMRERRSYIKIISEILGDPSLNSIEKSPREAFEKLRTRYEEKGVQHPSWRKALSRLNGLLELAVRRGALTEHPFHSQDKEWKGWIGSVFKRGGGGRDRRSLRAPRSEEERYEPIRNTVRSSSLEIGDLRTLFDLAVTLGEEACPISPEHFWVVRGMVFHALTGLRSQEVLALGPSDVEMDKDAGEVAVHVRYCVKMEEKGVPETWEAHGESWGLCGRLKTRNSERKVIAGATALKVLELHLSCPHRVSGPTLFSGFQVPTIPTQYRDRIQTHILPHLQINPRITPLGLRHTYATIALGRGVPLKVISSDLGHAKVATTMNYYLDYLPSQRRSAAHIFDDVLSSGQE